MQLVLNGQTWPMRLSLGALAELEADLNEDSLLALIERFETNRFRAEDVARLLAAGLRGAGWSGGLKEVLAADIEGGPVAAAKAAALLLARAFVPGGDPQSAG